MSPRAERFRKWEVYLTVGVWLVPIRLAGQVQQKPPVTQALPASPKPNAITHPAARRTRAKPRRVSRRSRRASYRRRLARLHPQPERIMEIQKALLQAGYLKQEPNGKWDEATRDAMRRFQSDHGFPVTGLPEAKSMMKLGLGPHPLPEDLEARVAPAQSDENAPTGGSTGDGTPASTIADPPKQTPPRQEK